MSMRAFGKQSWMGTRRQRLQSVTRWPVAENPLGAVEVAPEVIREVGDKFGTGELFLPEMVLAAEAMQAFMAAVAARLEADAEGGASQNTTRW